MIRLQPHGRNQVEDVRQIPYDLVKELTVALGIVLVLVTVLALLFSSPDLPSAFAHSADRVSANSSFLNERTLSLRAAR